MNEIPVINGIREDGWVVRLSQIFIPWWLANPVQLERFRMHVRSIMDAPCSGYRETDSFHEALWRLNARYSSGGISHERSLRSVLLNGSIKYYRHAQYEQSKACLALLIALHYDPEYIERHKWFDGWLDKDFPYGCSMEDISLLTFAGRQIGIDELLHISPEKIEETFELAYHAIRSLQTL